MESIQNMMYLSQEIYDKSWLAGGYPKQSCWGCRFGVDVITRLPFHSVLDAGTGNGALVRLMREHSKQQGLQQFLDLCQRMRRACQPSVLRAFACSLGVRLCWQPLTCCIHRAGKSAWGIELSAAVLKSECPDLLKKKVSGSDVAGHAQLPASAGGCNVAQIRA